MFKCSVQEGRQNWNRFAVGICFGHPRRARQILGDVFRWLQPPAPTASVDQPMGLSDGEHFGQRFDVLEFGVGERFPVSFTGASEEELDA